MAEHIHKLPSRVRWAMRTLIQSERCEWCEAPVLESTHGVVIVCQCNSTMAFCGNCFGRIVRAVELLEA